MSGEKIEEEQAERIKELEARVKVLEVFERKKLPPERRGVAHRFRITDSSGTVTAGYLRVNCYDDGRVGEVFVVLGKPGDSSTWIDQWAIDVSGLLQRGATIEELFGKHLNARFEPSGSTTHKLVRRCSSLVDYVSRWILLKYSKDEEVQKSLRASVGTEELDSMTVVIYAPLVLDSSMPSMESLLGVGSLHLRETAIAIGTVREPQPLCVAGLDEKHPHRLAVDKQITAGEVAFVDAALQSDCNRCRAKLNIGPVSQRGCELRPQVSYTPQPRDYPDRDRT